ncbi:MAG: hypothetical protein F4033_05015 [Acidimicrobiaceae bacterium]|nr:hypothetical protein [Acidimicrobiaceae bacterium]MYG78245.1 hypothetical protein [Acidimicrobiaceae bacterium]MYJ83541.1 hypothetical protein [Acidimicrobiaceae bacterium]
MGDATGDMMFSDVSEMSTFQDAINCLAYYGVTIGYGDGTFRPENDVSRSEMVLFMERAAGIAGADAEAVVGDFAMSGSDPVNRGDMALLIARLLVSATNDESPINVKNDDDGTFMVEGVDKPDYFADSRRLQNRVSDSAASALYELGVAKGTGMGYFSPGVSVSRGQMAAFITRALGHTSARPAGVSIQSDEPGEVIISVRDSNFQPVANAAVDVFTARADQVDEAFNEDGSCNTARVIPVGNTDVCEIGALDAITGLDGDLEPNAIDVNTQAGGTTVWAWTGERGDKIEDGGEGIAHINLTDTAPVTALNAKVTTDMTKGAIRAAFGSTITVTIQLVGANDADAGPGADGASYVVFVRSETNRTSTDAATADFNAAADDLGTTPAAVDASSAIASVTRSVLSVDADGMVTFPVTASDPDPNNADDPETGSVDRVRVTYTVTQMSGPADANDPTQQAAVTDGTATITFSDAPSVPRVAVVTPAVDYLAAPTNGAASNVVTVTVTDQYGKPVRGHMVRLSSIHSPAGTPANTSVFPVARRTDSSGSVRIGYSYTGGGSVESIQANTVTDPDATFDPAATTDDIGEAKMFYWAAPLTPTAPATTAEITTGVDLRVADAERNTLVIGDDATALQSVVYDENDQFVIVNGAVTSNVTMAAFEAELAKEDTGTANDIAVAQYNPTDASVVARFTLTVNA